MSTHNKKFKLFETEEGAEIESMLQKMATDDRYNTESSFNPNGELYKDNQMTFKEKHKNYLAAHPATDPLQYVANLRLMTRVR